MARAIQGLVTHRSDRWSGYQISFDCRRQRSVTANDAVGRGLRALVLLTRFVEAAET